MTGGVPVVDRSRIAFGIRTLASLDHPSAGEVFAGTRRAAWPSCLRSQGLPGNAVLRGSASSVSSTGQSLRNTGSDVLTVRTGRA